MRAASVTDPQSGAAPWQVRQAPQEIVLLDGFLERFKAAEAFTSRPLSPQHMTTTAPAAASSRTTMGGGSRTVPASRGFKRGSNLQVSTRLSSVVSAWP